MKYIIEIEKSVSWSRTLVLDYEISEVDRILKTKTVFKNGREIKHIKKYGVNEWEFPKYILEATEENIKNVEAKIKQNKINKFKDKLSCEMKYWKDEVKKDKDLFLIAIDEWLG